MIDPFEMLGLFQKWAKGMDNNLEDKTSYTTQYHDAFLKYVENEYCAKHKHLSIIKYKIVLRNNLFPSTMASQSGQYSSDTYIVFSNSEEYRIPKTETEMTPRQSGCAACLLITARICLNSPSK